MVPAEPQQYHLVLLLKIVKKRDMSDNNHREQVFSLDSRIHDVSLSCVVS
jgi:hypothetical protein